MRVLVTGGAGYVGSHAVKLLRASGHEPVVLDDLREGHESAVGVTPLERIAVQDCSGVVEVLRNHETEAVMHFAASCYVGDSVDHPIEYYENNVVGTLSVARACLEVGVRHVVFSSTAAVYGQPDEDPITEQCRRRPVNPYGRTKVIGENILSDASRASELRPVFLRYFNAAGADPEGELGEDHDPETHVIPNAIRAATGQLGDFRIFGDDYPTRDGTCVRDYVHVTDLAQAHVLALEYLVNGGEPRAFNLGQGTGFTVREVADMVASVVGRRFEVHVNSRRPGDPPSLVASPERARRELGWNPENSDLRTIVETAYRWMKENPGGYGEKES